MNRDREPEKWPFWKMLVFACIVSSLMWGAIYALAKALLTVLA